MDAVGSSTSLLSPFLLYMNPCNDYGFLSVFCCGEITTKGTLATTKRRVLFLPKSTNDGSWILKTSQNDCSYNHICTVTPIFSYSGSVLWLGTPSPSCWSTHHVLPPGPMGHGSGTVVLQCRGNEEFAKHVATHHDAHATPEAFCVLLWRCSFGRGGDFENVSLKRVEVYWKDKKFRKMIIEEKAWKYWRGMRVPSFQTGRGVVLLICYVKLVGVEIVLLT